jgi:hypothetical protein
MGHFNKKIKTYLDLNTNRAAIPKIIKRIGMMEAKT